MSGQMVAGRTGPGAARRRRSASAAEKAAAPPMDARVARCVLENVALARSKAAAELVAEACEALIHQADSDPADGSYALVKCFVPGDPEWVEFRLLTRTQCSNAAGIVRRLSRCGAPSPAWP